MWPTQTRWSSRTASDRGPAAEIATRRHGATVAVGIPQIAARPSIGSRSASR